MALPARTKTFGLENCRDVLRKLEWEIRHLTDPATQDPDSLMFISFNAAVTAWHLADWVWEDMTDEQRDILRADWSETLSNKGEFLHTLRHKDRAIAICREIATASKHVTITQSSDENVDAEMSAGEADVVTDDGSKVVDNEGSHVTVTRWTLTTSDGDSVLRFQDILERALAFWTELIYQRGIAK